MTAARSPGRDRGSRTGHVGRSRPRRFRESRPRSSGRSAGGSWVESWSSLRHLALAHQFIMMVRRLAEPLNLPFLLLDERVEPGHLDRVVALLVLAEAEEIRDVLWPPAIEEEEVLGVD